jgi:SPP1 gp7 family putative phage head morphogenesis protein
MPLRAHSRTIAVVRFLRAAAPRDHRRRGGVRVRQLQPDAIRLEYFNALIPHIRMMTRILGQYNREIISLLAEERAEQDALRRDASPRGERAKALIDKAKREAATAFRPRIIEDIADKYGKRTGTFQREQLDRVVRQQIGVPLSSVEKPIRDLIPAFTAENVALVKTVPERYHDRLRAAVEDAFDTGEHPETLAKRLVELEDISDSDARRIARDQIGKLNAEFNQERQEAMGVTGYTWRTANDNRVRDEHAERNGRHFEWNDPPEDGHPGEAVQCRCFSDPDMSAIIENL